MPANIEIKAKCHHPRQLHAKARELSGGPPQLLQQHDTFFCVAHGRLKLRRFGDGSAELIHYQRPDQDGPKACSYTLTPIPKPEPLRHSLAEAIGILGEIRKTRSLYLVGQTRIHFDQVEQLGDFLELEVVLKPDQSAAEGETIACKLMAELGIESADLIAGAYLDLLLETAP